MPATPMKLRLRSQAHADNITKRGHVASSARGPRDAGYRVGPMLLGFFVFVIVGSSLLQILRAVQGTGPL
ncbi:hypothetical protein SDRG_04385 [Saprolegnia diclina VS20]|uniref:Stress-associated endoplasmic reticulum protein n=1 Tax=Saprolegnia diclina (strain VS20) TaxID=1156394 RepID=T0QXA5_SAPDV|nr:hypothetical protein SDRG_04385 [Saprolegnia diclina VS20]EQC38690.1 hypothetical protein SDRG_04385 [Saprolegnia diclina VS20]|eukprot:XP_008608282.1 hypothetical protein SDRG_04385 [Saprolegnia diclina VS20]